MSSLLIKTAQVIVTMNQSRHEIEDGGIFVRDGIIEQVGATDSIPTQADQVLDWNGHIVLPGLINTHHHLYQNLTRAIPGAQNASLFTWLKTLYPIWAKLTPEDVRISALLGLAELILSGCTTSSDHLYLFPNGVRVDDEIHAAVEIGIRFHPTRGSMSIGQSKGGLPPDSLVESETTILKDCVRLMDEYHDANQHSMLRIALAPCSPFSVSKELMRDTAILARERGVRLHTHLAENEEDVQYSLEKFGLRPGDYAQSLGWVGEDVWHAHCVKLDRSEIENFARTGTGVAHCPVSNMRLGSGIAPIGLMHSSGVPIGIGVDGSASNDSAHLLCEARQAMLLQRVDRGVGAMTARQALELATIGGARVLGRDDIGVIAPGKCADFIAFDSNTLTLSGAAMDPVAALVFCNPLQVSHSVINGKLVVSNGHLQSVDLPRVIERHRHASQQLFLR